MAGFWVCVAAMVMTGWLVYAATYRAAYLDGWRDAVKGNFVPAGTYAPTIAATVDDPRPVKPCYPQDCDHDCEHSVLRQSPRAQCFPPGCNDFPECDHRY